MDLNDERLCAYLDGELAPARRAACESALAADLGAQQRLARLKRADEQLRAAFPLSSNPSEDRLAALILGDRLSQPRALPPSAVARRPWYRQRRLLGAMVAGLGGLALGLVLLGQVRQRGAGGLPLPDALGALLDQAPSGAPGGADSRGTRVTLSFKAADGRYCRVFEQEAAGSAAATEGLACRDLQGWKLLAQAPAGDAGEGLRPAGGSAGIAAPISRLGGGEALDGAQEQVLIGRHWQAAPR